MKIRDLMISHPICITANASIQEAIELMKANHIRHLPVVTKGRRLEGLVTLADLKQGLIPSMLGDVTLKDLMIANPITVSPEEEIETAAQLIYKYKIGGLPVTKNGRLVGIITETDLLRAFIEMLGLIATSSRLDVEAGNKPESLRRMLQIIGEHGGDVLNVFMTLEKAKRRVYHFRLAACDTAPIRKALSEAGFRVTAAID
ncbi:MAG: CBS and ACT domain-containing protein [Desulfobacterales bacterium]